MLKIELPFWLSATETKKLVAAAQTWWERTEGWVQWPFPQLDAQTCSLAMLDLLAWQRDIERFADEPESLYRLRVKYALINAQEAGSKAGFIAIFERLNVGYVEIEERFDAVNWDIIRISFSESDLASDQVLVQKLITKYGRTCRRYELSTITPLTLSLPAFSNNNSYEYNLASL